eukprot:TRINITY_DN2034_c0_g1::TRINITY_DN2034_c0_g1_i1::g.21844::m.21844 TRINITY_DN2034_c0_g1::TRINITY_DN2034_c0_g1_i1::g.21844  ORF type:complete len:324 (+),score=10.14,sp/Q9LY16/CCU42_ARATH/36.60/5e-29,Cyclin/PF08613.6/1.4e-28,Cyclin_N/PF00134.18/5.1e-11,Cyclin_N/PF00134.18/5.8e+03 TRINITY_DN2034_c0_g1_i1:142-1113(+)
MYISDAHLVGATDSWIGPALNEHADYRFIAVIACVLNQLVERNETIHGSSSWTAFHAFPSPPAVSIRDFILLLYKTAGYSHSCLIVALIYIDRLLLKRSDILLTSWNVHRLLLCAVMVASKFLDDTCRANKHYAKVGSVTDHEMNKLEVEFLFQLNFSLYVTPDLFEQYQREMIQHCHQQDPTSAPCACTSSFSNDLYLSHHQHHHSHVSMAHPVTPLHQLPTFIPSPVSALPPSIPNLPGAFSLKDLQPQHYHPHQHHQQQHHQQHPHQHQWNPAGPPCCCAYCYNPYQMQIPYPENACLPFPVNPYSASFFYYSFMPPTAV